MPKSVFLKEMGDTPKNRLWCFLIVHSEYDYSLKEIAKYSKVSYSTIKSRWKEFTKLNLVTHTRTVGKAKMYTLNRDNTIVERFIDFYWAVVDSIVIRDIMKEKAKGVNRKYTEGSAPALKAAERRKGA